jgi:hypothetical protein
VAVVVKHESAAAENPGQQPALCLVGIDAVAKGFLHGLLLFLGLDVASDLLFGKTAV